jgi:hypothetical protein
MVTGTVLALAVDGLVKVFYDRGASRLRLVVVASTSGMKIVSDWVP